jgi:alanine dehydrogenase
MAIGLGANVTVIDKSIKRLRELDFNFGNKLKTLYSTFDTIENSIINSDLIIGAVLIPGYAAPKLISRNMIKKMKPGTVLVDVAIDQGGCFETSKPTTHDNPTYLVDKVVHYCVANMPGAVSRTSAIALNNATLPFVLNLTNKGYKKALTENKHFMSGLNVYYGKID